MSVLSVVKSSSILPVRAWSSALVPCTSLGCVAFNHEEETFLKTRFPSTNESSSKMIINSHVFTYKVLSTRDSFSKYGSIRKDGLVVFTLIRK